MSDDPSVSQKRKWRVWVAWIARGLLVIVLLLSNAKLVTVDIQPKRLDVQSDQFCVHISNSPSIRESTALLLITHSRHEYLARSLSSIIRHHPKQGVIPIFVSKDQQDGEHVKVDNVVQKFANAAKLQHVPFYTWAHSKCYEDKISNNEAFIDKIAYHRISRHYHWALSRIFRESIAGHDIKRVIIVEDDMEIAADFFDYFIAFTPLLESDPSLFCISAWNDNGIPELAKNETQFHRTDFFPGLGWMLTNRLWAELEPKWPVMFWDDWLRDRNQTRGRQCIRPEVSRTKNYGEKGVSQSFHYQKHVSQIRLADTHVNFSGLDLTYLNAEAYDDMFFGRMKRATRLRFSNYLTSRPQDTDVIAFYPEETMESISKRAGVIGDHRNGIRRTSYKGVIVFPWNGHWAFVVSRKWRPPEGIELEGPECC